MAGGITCGDKPGLQSLQKAECSKGHRGRKPHAMEGVGDEVGKGWRRGRSGRGWRLAGTTEKVVDVAGTHQWWTTRKSGREADDEVE